MITDRVVVDGKFPVVPLVNWLLEHGFQTAALHASTSPLLGEVSSMTGSWSVAALDGEAINVIWRGKDGDVLSRGYSHGQWHKEKE